MEATGKRPVKRVFGLLREFEWVNSLLQQVGVKGLLIGFIGATGVSIWSFITGLSGPTILVYGILVMAGLMVLVAAVMEILRRKSPAVVNMSGGESGPPLEEILRRTFRNETVKVDGMRYIDCDFYDCKFQYEGGQYSFVNTRMYGVPGLLTSHPEIQGAMRLMRELHLTDPRNKWTDFELPLETLQKRLGDDH